MIAEPCYLCGTVTLRTIENPELGTYFHMCLDCQWEDWYSLKKYGRPYIPIKEWEPVFPTFH